MYNLYEVSLGMYCRLLTRLFWDCMCMIFTSSPKDIPSLFDTMFSLELFQMHLYCTLHFDDLLLFVLVERRLLLLTKKTKKLTSPN